MEIFVYNIKIVNVYLICRAERAAVRELDDADLGALMAMSGERKDAA
jgi:hypothetical protein